MTFANLIVPTLVALGLAAARYGGFVAVSPFPGSNAPFPQKMAVVVALAWFTTTAPDVPRPNIAFGLALLGPTFAEIACGVVIGFSVRLVMLASDILGTSLSSAIGLATPSVFDPMTEAQETPINRIVSVAATMLALGVGVHRIALAHLLESTRAMPVGSTLSLAAAAGPLLDHFTSSIEVGVRLSLPVAGVSLILQIALGMLARAAPSLQVFNVGFGITLIAGLFTFLGSLQSLAAGLTASFLRTSEHLSVVLSAIGGH